MHLSVIAKQPVPGRVKTRLCPPCTPEQAAEVAAAALADTLDAVERVADRRAVDPVLLFDGDVDGWLRPGWRHVVQRGDGLGARLALAFGELGAGVIVGMEAPAAVDSIGRHLPWLASGTDLLGLAVDGGYWAIGLCDDGAGYGGSVFDGVPMSVGHTGAAQLRRLHRLGRRVRMLPTAHDLDTVDDLRLAARDDHGRLGSVARSIVGG
jgi:uncharacterized protein